MDNKTYNIDGCFEDSLEQGYWQKYDSTNKPIESGSYEKGIRIGEWSYSIPYLDTSITWRKYQNNALKLTTNIPVFLDAAQEGDFFCKFQRKDKMENFSLVIAIHNIDDLQINPDSFYLLSLNELSAKGWKYSIRRQQISSRGKDYHFTSYKVDSSDKGPFEMINIYGVVKDRLVEVGCSFEKDKGDIARTIFVSVLSNLFLGKERFLNPYD